MEKNPITPPQEVNVLIIEDCNMYVDWIEEQLVKIAESLSLNLRITTRGLADPKNFFKPIKVEELAQILQTHPDVIILDHGIDTNIEETSGSRSGPQLLTLAAEKIGLSLEQLRQDFGKKIIRFSTKEGIEKDYENIGAQKDHYLDKKPLINHTQELIINILALK